MDDEVERVAKVLGELHLFLDHVPEHRLRETFNALDAELTVSFEHLPKGRRKGTRANVPTGVELKLGRTNQLRIPAGAADTPKKGVPVAHRTMLWIDSRGDWI